MLIHRALPYKLALKIFSYLDVKSLCRACRVCTTWKRLGEAEPLWQDLVKRKWMISEREPIKNWKKAYQSKLKTFPHDSMKHGCGTYTFKNGNRYEGDWDTNQRHGYGRMIYFTTTGRLDATIETYEGHWMKGKKYGTGRYYWSNSDRYDGDFVDGRREGNGIMIQVNQDRYEGVWKDNQLHGFGKAIKAKYVYEGDFVNGEKDGVGVITYDNGNKYEGDFKDGNKHGFGKDFLSNGQTFEGEFFKGKHKEEIVISKDQALTLDWKDVPEDGERLKDRRDRRKKLLKRDRNGAKRRRKKPPFVMPGQESSKT